MGPPLSQAITGRRAAMASSGTMPKCSSCICGGSTFQHTGKFVKLPKQRASDNPEYKSEEFEVTFRFEEAQRASKKRRNRGDSLLLMVYSEMT